MKTAALFWIIPAALLAGFGVGHWLGRTSPPAAAERSPQAEPAIDPAGPEADSSPAEASAPPVGRLPDLADLSPARLAALDPGHTLRLIERAFALPASDPERADTIEDLLAHLALTDPEDALRLAGRIRSFRRHEAARVAILETWGRTDPAAALAWARHALAGEPSGLRHAQLAALYRGFAENNAAAAFQSALEMDADDRAAAWIRTEILETVLETQVGRGEVQAALRAADRVSDPRMREDLIGDIVDEWAAYDPESAAAYVASLGPEAPSRLKTVLLAEWAENDPVAAAAWLDGLPDDDPAIPLAAARIIGEWTRYDLTASAEWLNSLPASPELDRAVAGYTFRAAQEDPAAAMGWAESITNERMRGGMIERVAATWREGDPEGFEAYLENSGFDDERKEALRKARHRGGWWRFR